MKFCENRKAFDAECGSEFSGEADYGVWRMDDVGVERRRRPTVHGADVKVGGEEATLYSASASGRYTVSVVKDTDDVYAWRTDEGWLALLANIGGGTVCHQLADEPLAGWAEGDGDALGRSLSWFVGRLADYLVRDEIEEVSWRYASEAGSLAAKVAFQKRWVNIRCRKSAARSSRRCETPWETTRRRSRKRP